MDFSDTLTRRVLIEGYVQGVGYRAFACRAALQLGSQVGCATGGTERSRR